MVKIENTERLPNNIITQCLIVNLELKEKQRREMRNQYIKWIDKNRDPGSNASNQNLERLYYQYQHDVLMARNWGVTSDGDEIESSPNVRVEAYMRTLSTFYLRGLPVHPNTNPFIQDDYCTFKPEHRRKIEEATRVGSLADDNDFVAHLYKDELVGIIYKDILLLCDKQVDMANTKIQQNMELLEAGPLYPPSKYFRDMNLDTAL